MSLWPRLSLSLSNLNKVRKAFVEISIFFQFLVITLAIKGKETERERKLLYM